VAVLANRRADYGQRSPGAHAGVASPREQDTRGYRPFQADLSGRIALLTGANSGMGKDTARELTRMGAQVILGCRSQQLGQAAANEIVQSTGSTGSTAVIVMEVDLSSPASVRAFAREFHEQFPKLDVLVNIAAVSLRVRQVTPGGFERHWATNVLGPHLLTMLLLPALAASGHGRIVTVSTGVQEGGPDAHLGAGRQAPGHAGHGECGQPRVRADRPDQERGGLLKVLVVLTSFRAKTPLEGADTTICRGLHRQ
jgi:nucleoside-diphosphate-sugar epimerase